MKTVNWDCRRDWIVMSDLTALTLMPGVWCATCTITETEGLFTLQNSFKILLEQPE